MGLDWNLVRVFVGKQIDLVFKTIDVDGSNTLSLAEFQKAVHLLFENLNKRMPCTIDMPPMADIAAMYAEYDKNSEVSVEDSITPDEFRQLVEELVYKDKSVFNSFLFKVSPRFSAEANENT